MKLMSTFKVIKVIIQHLIELTVGATFTGNSPYRVKFWQKLLVLQKYTTR